MTAASSNQEIPEQPSVKKRRRESPKKKKGTANTQKCLPPSKILVIDNGGDTIKFGWQDDETAKTMPNLTARLPQQWAVLAGDLLSTIQNPNQLIGVTRSTERGMIVNFGNQIQVWKRLLDVMNVSIPTTTDTAHAFGWKSARTVPSDAPKIPSQSIAVLLALPPFCPRYILDQITLIWMEDFGVSHVGFCTSPVVAAKPHEDYKTCCVVDMGWSCTLIVPTFKGKVIDKAIRRMPLGGRHLINMWKYFVSYRQWNLMDQDHLMRDVLEKAGFVSMDFDHDMQMAREIPAGRRPYDREYVLPDYQTTFKGNVRLPRALQKEVEISKIEQYEDEEFVDDENEEDVDQVHEGPAENVQHELNDEEDGSEDEEETEEQKRNRILAQRAENERRLREIEAEHQVLNLSVDRFAVPETLFHPADAGLPIEWANLPSAIVQAIESCPDPLQSAMYRSIRLIGGISLLKGLRERLDRELRSLAPDKYEISLCASNKPCEEVWSGACELSKADYTTWAISRDEWESSSRKGAWKRLLASNGGHFI